MSDSGALFSMVMVVFQVGVSLDLAEAGKVRIFNSGLADREVALVHQEPHEGALELAGLPVTVQDKPLLSAEGRAVGGVLVVASPVKATVALAVDPPVVLRDTISFPIPRDPVVMDISLSLSPGELDRVNELRKRDALISVLV